LLGDSLAQWLSSHDTPGVEVGLALRKGPLLPLQIGATVGDCLANQCVWVGLFTREEGSWLVHGRYYSTGITREERRTELPIQDLPLPFAAMQEARLNAFHLFGPFHLFPIESKG
jgi:hypothetical protein